MESAVPAGGVNDLPDDFRLNSMMDKLGLNRKVPKCNECDEDESVVAHCQTCNSYLCQICCERHKRTKRICDHIIVTVAKLRSKKYVDIQPKAISLTCREHDTELSWYCETCEQLVCEHCVVKSHYGHSYAKARLQACKCQIDLEAIAPVKMVAKDISEAHDTTDEKMKKVGL